jgi:hypothetical protein
MDNGHGVPPPPPPPDHYLASDGRWYPTSQMPGTVDTAVGAAPLGADGPLEEPIGGAWGQMTPATRRTSVVLVGLALLLTVVVGAALGATGGFNENSQEISSEAPSSTLPATSTSELDRITTTTRPSTTTTSTTTTSTTSTTTTTTTAPPPPTAPPTTAAPPPPPPPTAPPAVAAPSGRCHPSYSGCVPFASDVDCAGGSGNGPAYVAGPISVIGPDEYGLDSDNNGVACE